METKVKNTPGVDNKLWKSDDAKMKAVKSLKRIGYKAQALKRIYIPKKNRKKKRPLGIPTIKDRAMQALYLLALDPIAETICDNNFYGFRKKRSTADAIGKIFSTLCRKDSAQWVLEGDIKGCFDNINHEWLIKHIPIDKKILLQWLKAGIIFNKEFFDTESGTPQGGIISPCLALLTLNGLETLLKRGFKKVMRERIMINPKVHTIVFADDRAPRRRNEAA